MSNKSSHNLGMRPKPRRSSAMQEVPMGQTEERMYKFLKNKENPQEEEINRNDGINASNDRSIYFNSFFLILNLLYFFNNYIDMIALAIFFYYTNLLIIIIKIIFNTIIHINII